MIGKAMKGRTLPRRAFFKSAADMSVFRNRRLRMMWKEDVIIYLLLIANRPVVKSELMTVAKSLYWEGYPSGSFVYASQYIDKAFNMMVQCGTLKYEPRKPISIVEDENGS